MLILHVIAEGIVGMLQNEQFGFLWRQLFFPSVRIDYFDMCEVIEVRTDIILDQQGGLVWAVHWQHKLSGFTKFCDFGQPDWSFVFPHGDKPFLA